MKSIVSRAPALAVLLTGSAIIATACGGSQKELTAPQQAAAQAEDQAQKAQDEAQKAREEANKSQKALAEAQANHQQATQAEMNANQRAEVASRQAQIAEQQASMSAQPQAPKPAAPQAAQQQQGAQQQGGEKGVAEEQGKPKLTIISTSLLFKTNSADLMPAGKEQLDEVAGALNAQPQANNVKVQGYTDSTGTSAINDELSHKRAQTVADYLESKGVSSDRISVQGFGDQDPVSHEKTAEGRALNRRVDLVVEPVEGRANTQPSDKQQQQPQQQQQQPQQQQQQQQPKQQQP